MNQVKTGDTVYARTHAEYLNQVFGTNYKQWMRCVWNYDENTIVWMIRTNEIRGGYRNTFLTNDLVLEENLYGQGSWNGKLIIDSLDKIRIMIEVIGDGYDRKYVFRGVFKCDLNRSNPYKYHYYYRIADEI